MTNTTDRLPLPPTTLTSTKTLTSTTKTPVSEKTAKPPTAAILLKKANATFRKEAPSTQVPTLLPQRPPPEIPVVEKPTKPTPAKRQNKKMSASTKEKPTYVLDDKRVIIAVFNHKGGVAKTTISINLAYALSKTCNVLLTEADQQCNIQQFFTRQLRENLSDDSDDANTSGNEDDTENEEAPTTTTTTSSTQSDLKPVRKTTRLSMTKQSARIHKDAKPLPDLLDSGTAPLSNNLYDAIRNYIIGDDQKKTPKCHQLPASKNSDSKVWFLPGSQNIIELETTLSLQDRDSSGIGHHRLNAFRQMMLDTMNELDCRIAVVDFGPHSGLLNRVLVTSCDLIIPPCFPDALSFASSRSLLQSVLGSWFKWAMEFANQSQNSFMKKKLPHILPFIVTNFHIRSGSMYKNASIWLTMLQSLSTNDDLVNNQRIPVDVTAFTDPILNSNVIAICKHDEGLMGLAQNLGKPLIELDAGLTKAQQNSVKGTRVEFEAFSRLIMDIIEHKTVFESSPSKRKRTTSS